MSQHLYHLSNCRLEQLAPLARAAAEEAKSVCENAVFPLFTHKSYKQPTLDLLQSTLNAEFAQWFELLGWQAEERLKAIAEQTQNGELRLDFAREVENKQAVAVEVQLANQGRTAGDLTKFDILHKQGKLALGVYICFTERTANTADSGLATYEKALRVAADFPHLPLLIIGLERAGMASVDVSEVKCFPFAGVFGGKGQASKVVKDALAQAIINGEDLKTKEWSPHVRSVVRQQARKHVRSVTNEVADMCERISRCSDDALLTELFEQVLTAFKLLRSDIAPQAQNSAAAATPASSETAKPKRKYVRKTPASVPIDAALPAQSLEHEAERAAEAAAGALPAAATVRVVPRVVSLAETEQARAQRQARQHQMEEQWRQAQQQKRYHAPRVTAMQEALSSALGRRQYA